MSNHGTDAISGLQLVFSINGVDGPIESLPSSLPAGAIHDYTFHAKADLSGASSFLIGARTLLAGDTDPSNDETSLTLNRLPSAALPVQDDFESYDFFATSFSSGLINLSGDDLNFRVYDGPTPSGSTGPNNGASGSLQFIYIESSPPAVAGDFAILSSGCLDLSSGSSPSLLYAYHMYGDGSGHLLITALQGSRTDTLQWLQGQQHISSASPWLYDSLDLSPYLGSGLEIHFEAKIGDSGFSFNSDIALDDILIKDPQPEDLGVSSLFSPQVGCGLSAAETVAIQINNFGLSEQSGFEVGYRIDGPTGIFNTTESAAAITIDAGSSAIYTFSTSADFSISGTYAMTLWVSQPGDAVPGNDTLFFDFVLPALELPAFESFNGYAPGSAIFEDWRSDSGADAAFQIESGPTPTASTGPLSGADGGAYVFMESSDMGPGQTAVLRSTCIPLLSGTAPSLVYAYHMFGNGIGSLRVEVVAGAGTNVLRTFNGQQQPTAVSPWRYDTLDLSPFLGQSIELLFTGTVGAGGSFFNADIALDEIEVLNPLPSDVGVSAIVSPFSSCGDDAAAAVSVLLRNYGTLPQSSFNVSFSVEGPGLSASMSENIGALNIAAGEQLLYTFSSPIDLSADGVYTLSAWTELPTDAYSLNDSSSLIFENLPTALGLISGDIAEDFDSYVPGSIIFDAFFQDPSAELTFELGTGSTPTDGTGPSVDAGGSGGYVFVESSGSIPGNRARLCTECLDLNGSLSPKLEFAYHMFGSGVGSLQVDLEDISGISTPWQINAEQQSAAEDPWISTVVDLSPWSSQIVKLCLTATIGSTGSSFLSDIALDNILIRDIQPGDLSVTSLVEPVAASCDYLPSSALRIQVSNLGLETQSGFDVGYQVEGPLGTFTALENVGSLSVDPGGSAEYSFSTAVDLSADGIYHLKLFTALGSDAVPGNDTLSTSLENLTAISSFPYVQDFEAFSICGVSCTSDCSAAMSGAWLQDPTDDADWLPNSGATPTIGTGPGVDVLPGSSAGIYLYTEATGPCSMATANLISPCLDVSALSGAAVRFHYHMHGINTGTLALDISEDDGGSWAELWSRSGQDQEFSSSPWTEVLLSITSSSDNVRFRFRGTTGPGVLSDMAIDAFEVLDLPAFVDLQPTALVSPVTACQLGSSEQLSVELRNSGTASVSAFDVRATVSGPLSYSLTENVAGFTLLPGEFDTYTFSTPFDFSINGDYTIEVVTLFAGDILPANDTAYFYFSNLEILTLPQTESFNSYTSGTSTFSFMRNDPLADLFFETSFGPTSTANTGPDEDADGDGGFAYIESSFGTSLDRARMCTPCLDLSGGSTSPNLAYGYHMAGVAVGSLEIEVIQSGISTQVDLLNGPQQLSPASAWKFRTVDLSPWDDELIQVCFTGRIGPGSSGPAFLSDIALDELRFRDPELNDAALLDILSPVSGCELDGTQIVEVKIGNTGAGPLGAFDVKVQVEGGPVFTQTYSAGLLPEETANLLFGPLGDFSVPGDYLIRAWTSLTGDDDPSNDTLSTVLTKVPLIADFPYVEDFEGESLGWLTEGQNSSWAIGEPSGVVISTALSGSRALLTNPSGFYNNSERSQALSPCFDFSAVERPGVRLGIHYQTQAGLLTANDGLVLQSSVDQGLSWRTVGAFADPDNWYNFDDIIANPGDQRPDRPQANGWAGNSGGWLTALHALDGLSGEPLVQLRLAFASDAFGSSFDGIGVDDFIVAEMPSVELGSELMVCAGYVLDAGNPGSTYLWSTGATTQSIVLSTSGFYSVTVTDSLGFMASGGVAATVLPSPIPALGPDFSACEVAVLDAGNPGSTYLWSTGESTQSIVLGSSGNYWVQVSNASGCSITDTVQVLIQTDPLAFFSVIQSGGTASFSDASLGAESWFWDFGDGNTSSEQNPVHVYAASGNYQVVLVVSNACGTDTLEQGLAVFVSGLQDPSLAGQWIIYPVPSKGWVHLDLGQLQPSSGAYVGVFEPTGRLMHLHPLSDGLNLNLGHLAAGSYILRLDLGDGRNASRILLME